MFTQLTCEERFTIDKLFNQEHKSIRQISRFLNRNPSTISRELKRNCNNYGIYEFSYAHKKSVQRSWHNHFMYLLKYQEFTDKFVGLYDKRIRGVKNSNVLLKYTNCNKVSWRQIYNWIKSNRWVLKKSDKLRQYYKRVIRDRRESSRNLTTEEFYPSECVQKYIDSRQEFGHGELDPIIGKKVNGYENIVTLTERKTRILFMTKI